MISRITLRRYQKLGIGGPKEEFLTNFEKYKGRNQATFIEADCFTIDVNSIGKYNIFMYDGYHSYESHYKSLGYFIDSMEDEFILIVDDWNWEGIRLATDNSIRDLNLTTLWSKEIRLAGNNETGCDREGWWNGIGVFLLKK